MKPQYSDRQIAMAKRFLRQFHSHTPTTQEAIIVLQWSEGVSKQPDRSCG
ncbi:hypothetical protein [Synechococcus elongatus]|uniref:Uncharacterized protein n=1 Tax=Synechococcus elongatus PCC 11801 TaxID=2219813 RepID=A0AAQ3MCF9_SYNEL|nr:hypothetical protein [Synechococcus elongatus]